MPEPTIAEQIAEVKRELALRERVYPGLIARQKLKATQAHVSTARLTAVLATLMQLERHMQNRAGDFHVDTALSNLGFPPPIDEARVAIRAVDPDGMVLP